MSALGLHLRLGVALTWLQVLVAAQPAQLVLARPGGAPGTTDLLVAATTSRPTAFSVSTFVAGMPLEARRVIVDEGVTGDVVVAGETNGSHVIYRVPSPFLPSAAPTATLVWTAPPGVEILDVAADRSEGGVTATTYTLLALTRSGTSLSVVPLEPARPPVQPNTVVRPAVPIGAIGLGPRAAAITIDQSSGDAWVVDDGGTVRRLDASRNVSAVLPMTLAIGRPSVAWHAGESELVVGGEVPTGGGLWMVSPGGRVRFLGAATRPGSVCVDDVGDLYFLDGIPGATPTTPSWYEMSTRSTTGATVSAAVALGNVVAFHWASGRATATIPTGGGLGLLAARRALHPGAGVELVFAAPPPPTIGDWGLAISPAARSAPWPTPAPGAPIYPDLGHPQAFLVTVAAPQPLVVSTVLGIPPSVVGTTFAVQLVAWVPGSPGGYLTSSGVSVTVGLPMLE